MNDLDPARGPLTREEKSFFVVMGVIVGGFLVGAIVDDFEPRKFAVVIPLVVWLPLWGLHAVGHLVAARLVGWKLGEVVIGQARPIGTIRRSTYWELRLLPLWDCIRPVPIGRIGRLRLAFVAVAGSAVQYMFALAIVGMVGIDAMFVRSDDLFVLTAQLIAATAAVQATMQFIPLRWRTPEGKLPTDGGWLMRAWNIRSDELDEMGTWTYREHQRRWPSQP